HLGARRVAAAGVLVVVGRPQGKVQRPADRCGPLERRRPRNLDRVPMLIETNRRRRVLDGRLFKWIDVVLGLHVYRNGNPLTVGGERPHDSFGGRKILRHGDEEDAELAAREKVRRLSAVGAGWLGCVGGAGGNFEVLVAVTVVVPEQDVVVAVGTVEPSLEGWRDAVAECR